MRKHRTTGLVADHWTVKPPRNEHYLFMVDDDELTAECMISSVIHAFDWWKYGTGSWVLSIRLKQRGFSYFQMMIAGSFPPAAVAKKATVSPTLLLLTHLDGFSFLSKTCVWHRFPETTRFINVPNIHFFVTFSDLRETFLPWCNGYATNFSRLSTNHHLFNVVTGFPFLEPTIESFKILNALRFQLLLYTMWDCQDEYFHDAMKYQS